MTNVEFEGDKEFNLRSFNSPKEPARASMVIFLIRIKVAKSATQAMYILSSLIAILIIGTLLILFKSHPHSDTVTMPDGRIISTEQFVQSIHEGKRP